MAAAANSVYTTLPNRSFALMTSLNEPVSAILQLQCSPPGKGGGCLWGAITSSNAAAAALDNLTFARATKIPPIKTQGQVTQADEDPNITRYLQTQLIANGTNLYHEIMGMPQVKWFTMVDVQTGQTTNIYIGDIITVDYGNGYTEQWQFNGALTDYQWTRVPGSLMYNGQPVTPPTTSSGTPVPGYGSFDTPNPFTGGNISTVSQQHYCYGSSAVSIQDPSTGNWITSFGMYIFPC